MVVEYKVERERLFHADNQTHEYTRSVCENPGDFNARSVYGNCRHLVANYFSKFESQVV